jgi:ribonuclease HI
MGIKLFVDGSSRVIQGVKHNGYFVVEGNQLNVLEAGRLPDNWSSQTCKLYALNQALKLLKAPTLLSLTPPLELKVYPYRPGDYIIIKACKKEKLQLT